MNPESPRDPVATDELTSRYSIFVNIAAACIVCAAVRLARGFLVPLAIAGFLALVLYPLVKKFPAGTIRRTLAAVIVVLVTYGTIGVVFGIAFQEFAALNEGTPRYSRNINTKLAAVGEVAHSYSASFAKTISVATRRPFPMAVRPSEISATAAAPITPAEKIDSAISDNLISLPLSLLGTFFSGLTQSLLVMIVVAVLTTVFLIQQEGIRDRLMFFVAGQSLSAATGAFNEVATRITRYLSMQFVSNLTFASISALGLWFIGLPNPLLWGILALVLRFLPYIGTAAAAIGPVLLAFAAFDDWWRPLFVVLTYALSDFVCVAIIEPIVFGIGTGITPFAVVVSAFFWAWMWGGVGLVLATPITVTLVALGRYLPAFRPFALLFGKGQALDATSRLYQRLLGDDLEDAATILQDALKTESTAKVADRLLLPVLQSAYSDLEFSGFNNQDWNRFSSRWSQVLTLVEESSGSGSEAIAALRKNSLCLLAPIQREDEPAVRMLQSVLDAENIPAESLSVILQTGEIIQQLQDALKTTLILVSNDRGQNFSLRYRIKRLQQNFPDLTIVLFAAHDSTMFTFPLADRPNGKEDSAGKPVNVARTCSEVVNFVKRSSSANADTAAVTKNVAANAPNRVATGTLQ